MMRDGKANPTRRKGVTRTFAKKRVFERVIRLGRRPAGRKTAS